MTQKEKLYFEYLEIKNSIFAVMGKQDKQIDLDVFSETGRFYKEAKEHKVYQLEEMIKDATTRLQQAKKDALREAWFTTPEGAQWKRDKEAEIKSLYEQEQQLMDGALQHTSKEVQQLLGAHFDVTSFGSRSMTIGLVKDYAEDGRANAIFGHTFEVYFELDYFDGKLRWELNYGTLGGFDLDEDNSTRTQFLVGLAKFAADKTIAPALRDYLHDYAKQLRKLSNASYDAQAELRNPAPLANK